MAHNKRKSDQTPEKAGSTRTRASKTKSRKAKSSGDSMRKRKAQPSALTPEVLEPEVISPNEEVETEGVEADEEAPIELLESEPAEEDLKTTLPESYRQERDGREITEVEARAISPTDPLRRYLEEVRRYPLLEPEEEIRLATRLREEGDLDAAKRLVQANLRLVVKIALEYRNFYSNLLDLIQEGNVGLMKAVSKFDPTKGARLGYYASWWIRSYILKYILDNFRLVRIGTTQAQKKLFYHLMREKERLEAQGILAGPKLLAERLDVKEKDVVEMEQRLSSRGAEMSLDTPVSPDESQAVTYLSQVPDESESAEEQIAQAQLIQLLEGNLPEFEKQLDDREKRILNERLLAEEPKTLQEIANHYGLTRERARQIEAKLIEKLRIFLKPTLSPSAGKRNQ